MEITQEQLTQIATTAAESAAKAVQAELAKAPVAPAPVREALAGVATRIEVSSEERGLNVARFVMAQAAEAYFRRSMGSRMSPDFAANWARERFGERCPVVTALAIQSSSVTDGGTFVPEEFSNDLIEFLRSAAVVRRMGPIMLGMSGTLRMPRINVGTVASYKGEGSPPNATQQKTGDVILSAKKLIGIMPMSNDWIRRAVGGAETMFRNDLVDALATREDLAFIRGDGLQDTPKGLLNQMAAANKLAITTGGFTQASATKDLGRLKTALKSNNIKMRKPGWLMSSRTESALETLLTANGAKAFPEMADGKLSGYPYAMTTQIPENLSVTGSGESELYLVDFAEVVIGQELTMSTDVFTEGSYLDGNGVTQSLLANDETAVRIISEHDMALRHPPGAAVLKDVNWA